MLKLLDELRKWAEEIEPVHPSGRFGNKAFRTWHERLVAQASTLLQSVVSTRGECTSAPGWDTSEKDVCEEVGAYLCGSFGDATRIDYGSGHEAMFVVVLFCLRCCGVFSSTDDAELVLLVFQKYLSVARVLQIKYMLEPAGSHGVWGLDDYSFLPFLWGSSQLLTSQRISPMIVDDDAALQEQRAEYIYVDAIAFIKEMKKGSFFEHSPMLYDISRVHGGWAKINQGMILMYRGEVWEKRVVVQHLLFGNIFRFDASAAVNATTTGTSMSSVSKHAMSS